MKISKVVNVKSNTVVDIICDMCGKSCKDKMGANYEHSTFYSIWGFCSKRDGFKWNAHYCEECSEKIKDFIETQGGNVGEESYE